MNVDAHMKMARASLKSAATELMAELEQERGRRRGPLNQRLHEARRSANPNYRYSSQAGQDAVIDRIFRGKRDGTFVDVGGYDGLTGSNTFFLEIFRGWTGVLVEPVPSQLARARSIRRCPCIGVAVAATNGEADFIEISEGYTQMSGLSDSYDPGLLQTVRSDPRHKEKVHRIETQSLDVILDEAGLREPDFLSLDIEGGEVDALNTFPFDRYRPKIWSIENNAQSSDIPDIMRANGYNLIEFCGKDDIYADRSAINSDSGD
jgi:FkbM family methyltransferase